MTFKALLSTVIVSAGGLSINGFDVEEGGISPRTDGNFRLEIPDGEDTEFEFAEQEVTVDDDGCFTALDTNGNIVNCVASVTKPITETDLLKLP